MRRLLISTTALSVALGSVNPWPLMAQTVAEDGSIIADDGSILCLQTDENSCNIEDFTGAATDEGAAADEPAEGEEGMTRAERRAKRQAEREAAAQAEAEAAAQAEAEAAAQAEAEQQAAEEAAAAEAAAQAEAEAAAQAEAEQRAAEEAAAAEAAAQAEAEAAAQAEAEQRAAEEAAAAEAAAKAEAEAAAQAEAEQQAAEEAAAAEAAAQAEAEAAAQAEAEQQAAEEEAARQAEEEAARAAEEAAAEEAAAEEAATEEAVTEEAPAEEATTEEAPAEEAVTEETDPAAEDPALGEALETLLEEEAPAEDAVTEDAPAEEVPAEEAPADEAVTEDAPEGEATGEAATEEVVVPEVTEEAVDSLTELLADPAVEEPAEVGAAAALVEAPIETTEGEPVEIAPAEGAEVTVQTVTEESARSSSEEFSTKAAEGDTRSERQRNTSTRERARKDDDDGLSDLEKAGLVALGALAVGAIINANNRDRVVANTGDRVIVERGTGDYVVYKDDDTLLRRPGSTVRTESFRDGSTRTIVEREDGTQVVTIRDATGRVLRRATYDSQGREIVLIDDLQPEERIDVSTLPRPVGRVISISGSEQDALLKARMAALDAEELGRTFSLRQIREIREVRQLAATIDVNNITFDSGSAAIKATEAEELAALGRFITAMIRENPRELFLIEGHTDAVGSAASNLALSDRRAESVALALTEYFDVPPENMVVQGYGESELRVNTQSDERQNRRVAVRIVTPLLRTAEIQ